MEVEMVDVVSSNLAAVGYSSKTLFIRFHNGSVYEYHDVPAHLHSGLMGATSKGRYFWSHIRDRFKFKRVK